MSHTRFNTTTERMSHLLKRLCVCACAVRSGTSLDYVSKRITQSLLRGMRHTEYASLQDRVLSRYSIGSNIELSGTIPHKTGGDGGHMHVPAAGTLIMHDDGQRHVLIAGFITVSYRVVGCRLYPQHKAYREAPDPLNDRESTSKHSTVIQVAVKFSSASNVHHMLRD